MGAEEMSDDDNINDDFLTRDLTKENDNTSPMSERSLSLTLHTALGMLEHISKEHREIIVLLDKTYMRLLDALEKKEERDNKDLKS